MKERLTNPLFLVAVASLLFQVLQKYGVKIDLGTYQLIVDLLTYVFIGSGIYSTFKQPTAPQDKIDNIKY